ncbi:MAG: AMP-binding protein, partial [Chthonomonadales bacterium]
MEPVTIFAAVSASWRVNGNRSALTYHAGTQATEYTHAELQAIVHKLRSALWASGLRPGDRAALLSENRPEWAIADLACQSLGIVTIPIYPTIPQIQVEHILNDCMASIAFGSTKEQVAKLVQSKPNCSTLKHIIGLDVSDSTDSDAWSDLLGTADSCDKSPNDFDLL